MEQDDISKEASIILNTYGFFKGISHAEREDRIYVEDTARRLIEGYIKNRYYIENKNSKHSIDIKARKDEYNRISLYQASYPIKREEGKKVESINDAIKPTIFGDIAKDSRIVLGRLIGIYLTSYVRSGARKGIDEMIGDIYSTTATDSDESYKIMTPSQERHMIIKSEIRKDYFCDIAGLDDAKRELDMIIKAHKFPEVFQRNDAREFCGILFYGPPGNGKTMLARAMANEMDINFLPIKVSDITSKYFGESERIMQRYFDEARENGKTIMFFDELDSIATRRDGKEDNASRRILSTMLINLDGMYENKDIIVIGATNRIEDIDSALLRPRRLSKLIEVPKPGKEGRETLFRKKIQKSCAISFSRGGDGIFEDINDHEYSIFSETSKERSAADIEEIIERLKESRAYSISKGLSLKKISSEDIIRAIREYR